MNLTYAQIKEFGPCYDPIAYIPADWQGTAIDILKMQNVPVGDRMWVVVRSQLMTDRQLRTYGLKCARLVEHLSTNPRVKACNDATEAYLAGTITVEVLMEARAAAHAAYAASAYAAAAAASYAAYAAYAASAAAAAYAADAKSAAYAAAATAAAASYAAEAARQQMQEKQIEILISLLEQK